MERQKPARKGFGLTHDAGPGWNVRTFSEPRSTNGHTATGKSVSTLFSSMGFALTPRLGGGEEISEPYLESWVVHSCLRVISEAIEQVPFKIWSGPEETAKPLTDEHPVVKLFSRPNPWTSWSQLASMGSIHRNLSGEDFWFLADANGRPIVQGEAAYDPVIPIDLPVAIHSVNGTYVGDQRNPKTGRVVLWEYGTSAGGKNSFPAGSVLHFYNYDPTDPCRGVGPVEVAMRQLSIAFQAERYGEATLRSGGPGAFVCYENEMSPEVQREFQEQIDTAMSDPRAVGKIKILTGKPVVTPIPSNPKDMLSIDQLQWSRDVVASLLGVPLPIIGVLDNATYSNMKEAWRQFWLKIAAYLRTVEDVINSSFFPRLKERAFNRLRFGFDLSQVIALRADEAELIKLAGDLLAKGAGLTFNELLDLVGCQAEHPAGGDERLYSANLQTAPSPPRPAQAQPPKFLEMLLEELCRGTADSKS